MTTATLDVAIVGAGMAGASLAAALVSDRIGAGARILLIEAEAFPGYHATGRSAAFWTESYGGPGIAPLTMASGAALHDLGVLRPRGALTLARAGEEAGAEVFMARYAALGIRIEWRGRDVAAGMVPGLCDGWVGGLYEPDCCDIDVAALHQLYLATAARGGVVLRCGAGLVGAAREGRGWRLTLSDGTTVRADTLVNAAGAWADKVAMLAGAAPLGIVPYRRTMAQLRVAPTAPSYLPLVLDLGESFYFKPDNGRLWLSPHDETPSAACDAAPEEIDVARAIDRLGGVVDWQVEVVERRWAGLRSFAPDRLPVYGWDTRVPGLFWFAGQGGFGIQTAPAAAALAAYLLTGAGLCPADPAPYAPGRWKR